MEAHGLKPRINVVPAEAVVDAQDNTAPMDGAQCTRHPHRTNLGGICAFCLQEKLGKLVSSSSASSSSSSSLSLSLPMHRPSSSSSSSSPLTSLSVPPTAAAAVVPPSQPSLNDDVYHRARRARIPFLSAATKKKKKSKVAVGSLSSPSFSVADRTAGISFKRSKSTSTPRRGRFDEGDDFSPRRRGRFWSFLSLSSSSSASGPSSKPNSGPNKRGTHGNGPSSSSSSLSKPRLDHVLEDDDGVSASVSASASAASFERKVSRSRSVGCGSRSFSGDFFERISTGFGDCTLRRVESQREGGHHKPKLSSSAAGAGERVRCGGIFGGLMMSSASTPSSASTSSSYWVSGCSADHREMNGHRSSSSLAHGTAARGGYKGWGWAFASPMRAFAKPFSTSGGKREVNDVRVSSSTSKSNTASNATPNLSAIPSLLAVRG